MSRFLRLTSAALVLIGVIAAASAQAASNKPYTANVHVANAADPNTFTLTLTNDPRASQSLGSANFTPPPNFVAGAVSAITNAGFNVTVANNVVQFRAKSSATALPRGGVVSANVTMTIPAGAACSSSRWSVEAKQSNDFSGQPGNDMTLGPSDLTPLGSFAIADLGTNVAGVGFVPQILTGVATPVVVTANDTCGAPDADYSGGQLSVTPLLPARLQSATLTQPAFSGGSGTGAVNPVDVETSDQLTVTDPTTQITATSDPFDVVQTICAAGNTCQWQDKKVNPNIFATSTVPTGNGQSLGLGFNGSLSFTCSGVQTPVGSNLLNINPYNYAGTYQITLLYKKSVSGSRPANSFVVCLSDDNGQTWGAPLADCATVPVAPCVLSRKRVNSGDLQIILFLAPGDPWGGVG